MARIFGEQDAQPLPGRTGHDGCMNPGNVHMRARLEKFFRCECVKLEARSYRNMNEAVLRRSFIAKVPVDDDAYSSISNVAG
jgi:hypothetical protein